MMQYFSIWGASIHIPNSSAKQWVIPQSVQIMWAGLLLVSSLFCEESPRFLCRQGRPKAALHSLARLWNLSPLDPGIHVEVSNAQIQLELERQVPSRLRYFEALKELFGTKAHLKRIAFVFVLQCLGEWSGPNSVTSKTFRSCLAHTLLHTLLTFCSCSTHILLLCCAYALLTSYSYSTRILPTFNLHLTHTLLLSDSCISFFVYFLLTFYPYPAHFKLIHSPAYAPELFGIFGIQGQSQKLFTTAIFGAVKFAFSLISALFLIDSLGRRKTLYLGLIIQVIALTYDSVFLTVFSSLPGSSQLEPATKHAAIGAIVMIYFIGIGWALGWNSIQYLITAESFPLGVRIAGVSLVTLWHYANRIGISKVCAPFFLHDDPRRVLTGRFL